MFKNYDVSSSLMLGGAGFSYPKYYINKYPGKTIDVVEINPEIVDIAKEYFYLSDLYKEKDCNGLNIIIDDARHFINTTRRKYDTVLNDTFFGNIPEKNLTTVEAIFEIKKILNDNGQYLTNIISSLEGEASIFLKSEMNTINKVFKFVYAIPCSSKNLKKIQNIMVIASDVTLALEDAVAIKFDNSEIITDMIACGL